MEAVQLNLSASGTLKWTAQLDCVLKQVLVTKGTSWVLTTDPAMTVASFQTPTVSSVVNTFAIGANSAATGPFVVSNLDFPLSAGENLFLSCGAALCVIAFIELV